MVGPSNSFSVVKELNNFRLFILLICLFSFSLPSLALANKMKIQAPIKASKEVFKKDPTFLKVKNSLWNHGVLGKHINFDQLEDSIDLVGEVAGSILQTSYVMGNKTFFNAVPNNESVPEKGELPLELRMVVE